MNWTDRWRDEQPKRTSLAERRRKMYEGSGMSGSSVRKRMEG